MTTDETARLHLYEQARASWDDEAARTLMTALPWDVADLATKQDLRELEHRLQAGFERSLRLTIATVVTVQVATAGIILSLVPR